MYTQTPIMCPQLYTKKLNSVSVFAVFMNERPQLSLYRNEMGSLYFIMIYSFNFDFSIVNKVYLLLL